MLISIAGTKKHEEGWIILWFDEDDGGN